MKKTLFKKYLRITTAVILISFAVISIILLLFVTSYWKEEKRSLLMKNTESVAAIASHNGILVSPREFAITGDSMQEFMLSFARNVEADMFLTNRKGEAVFNALGSQGDSVDVRKPIDADVMRKALNGRYSEEGTLGGKYGSPHYVVGVPILVSSNGKQTAIGAVFAAYNVASFNTFRWSIVKMLLLALLAAFAISFAIVWAFTYNLVRPLRNMASAARSFGKGDFSARVPVTTDDEIGQLALAFNSMADSLSSSESSSRSFIANVSHELKTPMTTIAGFIDGILDGTIPPEKEKHYLGIVSQEVKRLSRMVRTMLDLSRIDSGAIRLRPACFDLTNTILVALLSFEQKIEEKKIDVRGLEENKSVWVEGDPDLLHQVVYNLIDNAVKFTQPGGYLKITVTQGAGRAAVGIENSGPGIAPDELPMVFERFYKTDKSRSQDKNGMGLGLYIVRTIVRLHGGEITVNSRQNVFTRFEFWIPDKVEKTRDKLHLVETTAEAAGTPPQEQKTK